MNNPKTIRAWCSYDVANSVYNLIISTVLFPIYYTTVTRQAFAGDTVTLLGMDFKNTVLYDYVIAAAYFVVVLLSPILSGIADFTASKKRFMQFFTYMGAAACFGLYWFAGQNIGYGLLLAGLAVVGYAGSLVFYNSFLPLIASPDRHDSISARGFSWGYGGSVLLLVINIVCIETYSFWGFADKLQALKFSFLEVGIWWAVVSVYAFVNLKDEAVKGRSKRHFMVNGFHELAKVAKELWHIKDGIKFLSGYFFYSIGVQTIILVAALFGSSVLQIPSERMIFTIILLQLVAMAGAHIFAKVSEKQGNRTSISIMLLIWVSVCISAYLIHFEYQFYLLAAAVGLVMGGIQSQSRSAFSKLIPAGTVDTASYFSFYDVTEKLAIVFGMFLFGFTEHLTGSMRFSALIFSLFFIAGLVFIRLTKLKYPKKQEAAFLQPPG